VIGALATPDDTAPTPLSMLPFPPEKLGVKVKVPPLAGEVVLGVRPEATGAATTVTVVLEDLLGSPTEVAVMV
jgi:hypothetical protein